MKPKNENASESNNTAQSKLPPQPPPYDPEKLRNWLQDALRLANAYWQETVQPFIAGPLDHVAFEVALNARQRLENAVSNARTWNLGNWPRGDGNPSASDAKEFPIDNDKIPQLKDLPKLEVLHAHESLNPETLAIIAAQLTGRRLSKRPMSEAVRMAHTLLLESENYLESLRKSATRRTIERTTSTVCVTVDEILRSNKMDSGQLPLLPPVQKKRNLGELSAPAIVKALPGVLKNNSVSVKDLCEIRWQRFKKFWDQQRCNVKKRDGKKPSITPK